MASISNSSLFHALSLLSFLAFSAQAQLSSNFYAKTCPNLQSIVSSAMAQAVAKEPRMAASILRLFFHDCFVNGCDGSILLDDTATFTGEKNAFPNKNSARGFEVIDAIKSNVEASCNATVSCADILALASRDGVVKLGGPTWTVGLGRRDATTASQSTANSDLPGPSSTLSTLISMFSAKGLNARDMTALSGAHTIGQAQCQFFRSRIYNDNNINPSFATLRQGNCPQASGGDSNLAPLDVQSPNKFGAEYYQNLLGSRGLLHSDQELFNNGTQDALVRQYSQNRNLFFSDFAAAMIKMGAITPLTGTNGEIPSMASMSNSSLFLVLSLLSLLSCSANAQLSANFYAKTCPNLQAIVRSAMARAVSEEPRMAASILRLFFHDCFVNGCDGSILLDDTPTFTGEKNAFPNKKSTRGFEVIDAIKSSVEASCKATVSCADILALASRDGVVKLGGPKWTVALGRRDATSASQSTANSDLPAPSSSLSTLISKFAAKGLSARDMTALSGAHTIGQAQCQFFRSHIYNDNNTNPSFATLRQGNCPISGGDTNLAPLDVQSPNRFGSEYYKNLLGYQGLLHSDQELFNNGAQDGLVRQYSQNRDLFFSDFAAAMIKMGAITPLIGSDGEIPSFLLPILTTSFDQPAMASISHTSSFLALFILLLLLVCSANAQLSPNFYAATCPNLQSIVRSAMAKAVNKEPRMAASILRLFFHDCFVNGCDGSILLDDTTTFTGEKNAFPNKNSARGFEVIDAIKSSVEASCKATVSCADILALASRDGVVKLGGPKWTVALGRRDATTASQSTANSDLPGPSSTLSTLISKFAGKGLNARDMTALSGAHTIGQTQCQFFRSRIYNDDNINPSFATLRQGNCPQTSGGGDINLAPLDVQSPNKFGAEYYRNLLGSRGLLHSDQELFNNGTQDALVRQYSKNKNLFFSDFAVAMVKMGAITPLTGSNGEIRLNCRKVNS
ncbi:hypothetical protein M5K25_025978 [Dendrobium thyrsiflorum]|uniref:Peroxidase 1 n=1 Tax=Dendrobium thyrsiflorum TaxID=117978 RepID=A0ABD0TW54_DENTH